MKKLAIFDFDGTLIDSIHDVVKYLNETLSMYDFPTLTSDEYVKYLGGNIDEIVALILEDNATPENIKQTKDTYLDIYYRAEKENTVPFNDSIATFTERHFGDIDFFMIMGHDFDYPSKPDPHAVLEIIKRADVDLSEVIYIGDSGTDIQTARNAGIECVIVKWGYGNEKDWEDDYVLEAIDDFDEIIKYF